MAPIVTSVIQLKGGVGKTLVTGNIGIALAGLGKKVLMIDNDPQANLTNHFSRGEGASLAAVIDKRDPATIDDAVVPTGVDGLFVVDSGGDELQAVQDSLVGQPGADQRIAAALRKLTGTWDHVIIDCRPATDLITRNAMMAADQGVIVIQPEHDALQSWTLTQTAIDELDEFLQHKLPVAGIIINMLDRRRSDHAENLEYIHQTAKELGIAVLGDPIPMSTDLSKLAAVGMSVEQLPKPSIRLRGISASFREVASTLDRQEVKA